MRKKGAPRQRTLFTVIIYGREVTAAAACWTYHQELSETPPCLQGGCYITLSLLIPTTLDGKYMGNSNSIKAHMVRALVFDKSRVVTGTVAFVKNQTNEQYKRVMTW